MDMLALILSIIGSINWGLVGIFKFDLVAWIFGGQTAVVSRIIYTIVCRTEPQWPAGSLFFSFYQSSAAATVGTTRMPAAMSIV